MSEHHLSNINPEIVFVVSAVADSQTQFLPLARFIQRHFLFIKRHFLLYRDTSCYTERLSVYTEALPVIQRHFLQEEKNVDGFVTGTL